MRKTPYTTQPIRMHERAVERLLLGERDTRLAKELDVHRTTLYGWKCKVEQRRLVRPQAKRGMAGTFGLKSWWTKSRAWRLSWQWLELDFFDSALRRIAKQRQRWRKGDYLNGCQRR